jgi:hypothetical protein
LGNCCCICLCCCNCIYFRKRKVFGWMKTRGDCKSRPNALVRQMLRRLPLVLQTQRSDSV